MANTASAKKAIRVIARKTSVNRNRVTRIRTFIKKVHDAIDANDKAKANEALRTAQSEIMRGVTKSVIKRNTASRTVSRLSKKIAALS